MGDMPHLVCIMHSTFITKLEYFGEGDERNATELHHGTSDWHGVALNAPVTVRPIPNVSSCFRASAEDILTDLSVLYIRKNILFSKFPSARIFNASNAFPTNVIHSR